MSANADGGGLYPGEDVQDVGPVGDEAEELGLHQHSQALAEVLREVAHEGQGPGLVQLLQGLRQPLQGLRLLHVAGQEGKEL
jgi:hypothetical protein